MSGFVVITYKHGIYDLTHELPNDLRLRILGICEIAAKCLNFIEWGVITLVCSLSAKMEILSILAKDFWKIEIKIFS